MQNLNYRNRLSSHAPSFNLDLNDFSQETVRETDFQAVTSSKVGSGTHKNQNNYGKAKDIAHENDINTSTTASRKW